MVRSLTTAVAGNVLRMSGDLDAAIQATTTAVALAQAADANYIAVDARCDLVVLQIMLGQLHRAVATCQKVLRLAGGPTEREGRLSPIMGLVSARLSQVLCEWNNLEDALRYANEGLQVCRDWGQASYLVIAYGAMAKILQAMGDTAGALDAIQHAAQVAADLPSSIIALLTAVETQIRLAQGDTAAARRWAQSSSLSVGGQLLLYRYQEYRTLVLVLITQNELFNALALLARLLEMAETTGAMSCAIESLVLQALVLQAQGQDDRALKALGRALVLAEPEGYVRTFINVGLPMAELLKQAIAQGITTRYAHSLLTALEGEISSRGPILSLSKELIEPLSEREIEVLRLLITHLSRKEIADQLCVSPNTVRFHLKNIYTKLGVHSRSDAVQRAEELNLL